MTLSVTRRFAAALALPGILVFAPPALAQTCPLSGQKPTLVAQMFFGQSVPGGRDISAKAWHSFLRREVTTRFPDGFTVFDAYGQWRDRVTSHVGRERTKVLEIATDDAPDVRTKLDAIAARYRTLFHQQSVGIVTMPGCARF
jgi:hypothetical protein